MAGLDPAIHEESQNLEWSRDVDPRVKARG
jgi:hypothetical protein